MVAGQVGECDTGGCKKLRDLVDEQQRTIAALMCGMPEDGTTPVIRRIARLETALESGRQLANDYATVCRELAQHLEATDPMHESLRVLWQRLELLASS